MSDREKLLTALLRESERRSAAQVSVVDVMSMLERLGSEYRAAVKRQALLVNASLASCACSWSLARTDLGIARGRTTDSASSRI